MVGIQEDTRPLTRRKPETHTTAVSIHDAILGSPYPGPVLDSCRNLDQKPQTPLIQLLLHRSDHLAPQIGAGEAEIGLKGELAPLGLNNRRVVELREQHLLGGVHQGDLHAIVDGGEVAVGVGEGEGDVALRHGGGGVEGDGRDGSRHDVELRERGMEDDPHHHEEAGKPKEDEDRPLQRAAE